MSCDGGLPAKIKGSAPPLTENQCQPPQTYFVWVCGELFNLLQNILLPRVLKSCHSALAGLTFSWQEMGGWVQDEDWGYLYKNTLQECTVIHRLPGWFEILLAHEIYVGEWVQNEYILLHKYMRSTCRLHECYDIFGGLKITWVHDDAMSGLTHTWYLSNLVHHQNTPKSV